MPSPPPHVTLHVQGLHSDHPPFLGSPSISVYKHFNVS
jgi:hypothetical protein